MVRTWLIAATAIAATSLTQPDPAQAFNRLEVGQLVADHTLMAPGGETRQLASALGSRATAIAFWAHWSPRSREALQGVQELLAAYGAQGLEVVAVNVDGADPATEIDVLLAEAALQVTQLVDTDLSLYAAYGVVAVPSLVLLDGSGRVAALTSGYSSGTRETFAAHTRKALGVTEPGRSPTGPATGYQPRGSAQTHFRMAQLYLRKHRTEQALELLAKALAEDPLYTEARDTLAGALRQAGRSDDAARLELAQVGSEEYCLVPRRGHAPARWQ